MTTERIPLSSPMARAMSVFQTHENMMIGAATVMIAATLYAFRAFKAYEAKKHRAKIEKINDLHKNILETIIVPGFGKIKGFPSIFQFENQDDTSPVQSMHFSDNQIEEIGTNMGLCMDPGLLSYQENVKNAIFKLKEYYLERGKKTDVTAGVLSYLMYILEEKCAHFSGYDYDIAYMEAISRFINAYASIKGIENSQHFSRLSVVYRYISQAKQELIKYKAYLSLEYFIGQLAKCGMQNGDQLLRLLTKLIIEKDRYVLLKTVTQNELKQGILRQEYVKGEFKGLEYAKHHQIDLPKSIFKNWIMNLSKFYIKAQSRDKTLKELSKFSPENMIHYIKPQDLQRNPVLSKNNSKHDFEKQLDEIRSVFKNTYHFISSKLEKGCGLYLRELKNGSFENSNESHLYLYRAEDCLFFYIGDKKHTIKKQSFIDPVSKLFDSIDFMEGNVLENDLLESETKLACDNLLAFTSKKGYTKLGKKHSHPVYVPISDRNEVMQRVEIMAKFAKLVYSVIALQYFCIHLLNSIKELGDIYVKDPYHFIEIFDLLEKLCAKICDDIDELQKDFIKIHNENNNSMRIESEELIPKKIEEQLNNTKLTIIDLIKDIKEYRNNAKLLSAKEERQAVKSEMLNLARKIASTQNLISEQSLKKHDNMPLLLNKPTDLSRTPIRKKIPKPNQAQTHRSSSEQWPIEEIELDIIKPSRETNAMQNGEKNAVETLQDVLANIKQKIKSIKSEGCDIKTLKAYQKIYDYLNIMTNKSVQLVNQKNKSKSRTIKANRTFALTDKIAKDTLTYFHLNESSRRSEASTLAGNIHKRITSDKNSVFIDDHQNGLSKFIYNHICKIGIFRTDTRKKLSRMDAAYQDLLKL